jgi:hypothetical protein
LATTAEELPYTTIEEGLVPPFQEEGCVEFRLLYSGFLPPDSENARMQQVKHDIRREFLPQLKQLWQVHPNLQRYLLFRGLHFTENAQNVPESEIRENGLKSIADTWRINDFRFLPLIEERYCLACSVDILFLRVGGPGSLIKNGDIDNRVKTLFDALKMPKGNELGDLSPLEGEDPFYCLFEDDKLISEVKVTTDRLLWPLDKEMRGKKFNAHLVISVKAVPTQLNSHSHIFQ